jgi:hypothetical protein
MCLLVVYIMVIAIASERVFHVWHVLINQTLIWIIMGSVVHRFRLTQPQISVLFLEVWVLHAGKCLGNQLALINFLLTGAGARRRKDPWENWELYMLDFLVYFSKHVYIYIYIYSVRYSEKSFTQKYMQIIHSEGTRRRLNNFA